MAKSKLKSRTSRSVEPVTSQRVYLLPALPVRPFEGHKGLFGRVLVVGGNDQMFGAATLAATAALRSGSGLVQVAAPAEVLPFALSITPELIGLGLEKSSDKALFAAAEAAKTLVLGPGMGQSKSSRKRLLRLLAMKKPTVVDADAINLLARESKLPRDLSHCVFTPHPGEFQRLGRHFGIVDVPSDDRGRLEVANRAAQKLQAIVVLKGHRTVVADSVRAYVNQTGNSSLSKAGSGDVLAGIVGSLIGQGMGLFDAACAGCWIHGKAGEIAGATLGLRSVLARDVIGAIGNALNQYPNQDETKTAANAFK